MNTLRLDNSRSSRGDLFCSLMHKAKQLLTQQKYRECLKIALKAFELNPDNKKIAEIIEEAKLYTSTIETRQTPRYPIINTVLVIFERLLAFFLEKIRSLKNRV